MDKQEKIREGIVGIIALQYGDADLRGDPCNPTRESLEEARVVANQVLSHLHSQGVVIKVDKGFDSLAQKLNYTATDKLHYVVTEPLIKDN